MDMIKMAMTRILLSILILTLTLYGCSSPQDYMLSEEEVQKEEIKEQTGVSNPATLYCMNQTGTSWEVRENEAGQYGICIFPDGSWCEEWAYYRGHCTPGTNVTSCEGQFRTKSICPPTYNPVCGKLAEGGRETFSNSCVACNSEKNVTGYAPGECE